jgi:hypothetical protein
MNDIMDFQKFSKIPRLSREIIVTEKIDGTNGQIYILPFPMDLVNPREVPEGAISLGNGTSMLVGSRTRWLTEKSDNYGFWRWAHDNRGDLEQLGEGRHFGEWWGSKIQRNYGLPAGERHFSLFNTSRWSDDAVRPACCRVVPTLYTGVWTSMWQITQVMWKLKHKGSFAQPGYMNPEGVVIFHTQSNISFKKTIEGDEKPKGSQE